jgi:hypothetical protein
MPFFDPNEPYFEMIAGHSITDKDHATVGQTAHPIPSSGQCRDLKVGELSLLH